MGKNKVFKKLILSLLLFLFFTYEINAGVIDRIVAIAGDDLILLSNLKKSLLVKNNDDLTKIPKEKQELVLDELIERSLLSQKAKKLGISVLEKEIDEEIENVKNANNITTEVLIEALKKEGLTLEDYRNIIRHQIIKAKIISREIRPNLYITDELLRSYYEKEIAGEDQKHISFDVLTIYDDKSPGFEEDIKELYKSAKNGASLPDLETKTKHNALFSSVESIKFSELAPELKDAMKDLKENQLGPLVRFSQGFQIFILKKITYKGLKSFEEAKEELKKTYTKERLNKLYQDYLTELKKEFYVEKRL
ncbi:MAG: SurA N-terminal domain-containing protein [Proteobacteria bacterium]|nr:SurA N-terminal domain-containing protein [Pseudomonadota bacterium]